MNSPNSLNCSAAGLSVLADQGISPPPASHCPTGAEYARDYLLPLAAWLRESGNCEIRCNTTVIQVGRMVDRLVYTRHLILARWGGAGY